MNRVVHFEIHAKDKDMDKMQKFYQDVFGWEFQIMGEELGNYRVITTGRPPAGEEGNIKWAGINGGMTMRQGEPPRGNEAANAYVCIIGTENIDETLKKVKSSGGTMALDKMNVPTVGQLAYCKDPEGNLFGVIEPVMPEK